MYIKNRSGQKTVTCGNPKWTGNHREEEPSTSTHRVRSLEKSRIQSRVCPVMPQNHSSTRSLLWEITSKASDKSSNCYTNLLLSVIPSHEITYCTEQLWIETVTRTKAVVKLPSAVPRLWWHLRACGATAMTENEVSIPSVNSISWLSNWTRMWWLTICWSSLQHIHVRYMAFSQCYVHLPNLNAVFARHFASIVFFVDFLLVLSLLVFFISFFYRSACCQCCDCSSFCHCSRWRH